MSKISSRPTLEILFDSRLKVKILKYLFRNNGSKFSLNELSSHVQEDRAVVRKEINKLLEMELLIKAR